MWVWAIIILLLIGLLVWHYGSEKRVVYFFQPSCKFCQDLEPEWQKFVQLASTSVHPIITTSKVNLNDSKNRYLVDIITTVPLIAIVDSKGNIVKPYEGNRKASDILEWVIKV